MHAWQSEFTDGPKGGWTCAFWGLPFRAIFTSLLAIGFIWDWFEVDLGPRLVQKVALLSRCCTSCDNRCDQLFRRLINKYILIDTYYTIGAYWHIYYTLIHLSTCRYISLHIKWILIHIEGKCDHSANLIECSHEFKQQNPMLSSGAF